MWRSKGLIPKSADVSDNLVAIIKVRESEIESLRERIQIDPETDALTREKIRLTKAQADMKEIEVLEKAKELLPVTEAGRILASVTGAIRAKLLNLSRKAAPELQGESEILAIEQVLNGFVYECLTDLSGFTLTDSGNSEEDPGKDDSG